MNSWIQYKGLKEITNTPFLANEISLLHIINFLWEKSKTKFCVKILSFSKKKKCLVVFDKLAYVDIGIVADVQKD